jgi:hypothetical protein
VKVGLFAACPPTVTENVPEDAPAGTTAIIVLSLQDITLTLAEFNEIVLVPCVAPKPVPAIETDPPTAPLVGEMLVMVGAAYNETVNDENSTRTSTRKFFIQLSCNIEDCTTAAFRSLPIADMPLLFPRHRSRAKR